MARVIDVPPGLVTINVEGVDDGAGVFFNEVEVLHVHYKQSDSIEQEFTQGEILTIRFEVYNLTGGSWQAHFTVNAAGKRIYDAFPREWTFAGWNVAFRDEFVLRVVSSLQAASAYKLEELEKVAPL